MKWAVFFIIIFSFVSASYLVSPPFKDGQCIYEIDRHDAELPKVPFKELTFLIKEINWLSTDYYQYDERCQIGESFYLESPCWKAHHRVTWKGLRFKRFIPIKCPEISITIDEF